MNGTIPYECEILETNRHYEGNLLQSGYFFLQIAVEQIVYVTSVETLSVEQVTDFVLSGFNRGAGGRVRFMSLLQESSLFDNVQNVEVLENGLSTTPPIATNAPTAMPTAKPTSVPTQLPTSAPTLKPIPTNPPTARPSMIPVSEGSGDSRSASDQQALILGAIAGAVAMIFVSCFFVFCVWLPLCGKERHAGPALSAGHHPGSLVGSISHNGTESTVPGLLHLDDDARSLAETTVTLGDRPLSRKNGFRTSKRLAAPRTDFQDTDSCESSIYTSTFPAGATDMERFQGSPSKSAIAVTPKKVKHTLRPNVSIVNEVSYEDAVSDTDSEPSIPPIEPEPETTVIKHSMEQQAKEAAYVQEMITEESKRPKLPKKDTINHDHSSTKGFDPFSDDDDDDDDSSFEFNSSVALSDPSFGPPVKESPSTSVKTQRIENLVTHVVPDGGSDSSMEEAKEEAPSSVSVRDRDGYSVASRRSTVSGLSNKEALANNALLRSILEEASHMASRGSSRSRASAPSRIHKQSRSKSGSSVGGVSYFADTEEIRRVIETSPSRSVGASQSVGPHPRKSYRKSKGRPYTWRSNNVTVGATTTPAAEGMGIEVEVHGDSSAQTPTVENKQRQAWLFDAGEEQLGARPMYVDLGGASVRSTLSNRSIGSLTHGSVASTGSRPLSGACGGAEHSHEQKLSVSSWSHVADASVVSHRVEEHKTASPEDPRFGNPRALDSDFKKTQEKVTRGRDPSGVSPMAGTSSGLPPLSRPKRVGVRRTVRAPPGKIGIILANRHDGKGTVVDQVRSSSVMKGKLSRGDTLVAVDGQDVQHKNVGSITAMMAARAAKERKLTVIQKGSGPARAVAQESKMATP